MRAGSCDRFSILAKFAAKQGLHSRDTLSEIMTITGLAGCVHCVMCRVGERAYLYPVPADIIY